MAAAASTEPDVTGLSDEVRRAVINQKANACPIIIRLAWHASGTFEKDGNSGGSGGASMRFEPEASDDANAGLSIARDMLKPVQDAHPNLSISDIWTFAGSKAVEFLGGPAVPFKFGRKDCDDGSVCPPNGRLPDAAQGAEHVREVFYRMGFNDQEIVALSGAHTLGRCHLVRSGFDGPWTRNPLKFDNDYFKELMFNEWQPKKWDGPLQYEDVATGELMMLPTDMALKTDPEFVKYTEAYAKDQDLFFRDFSAAFSKLLALGTDCGCPGAAAAAAAAATAHTAAVAATAPKTASKAKASAEFREAAMHGSLGVVKKLAETADVHAPEDGSLRTALHKAAFWGHDGTVDFLLNEAKLTVNACDASGDTALHDASRYGHEKVVKVLLAAGADPQITNKDGHSAIDVAEKYGKPEIVAILRQSRL